MSDVLEILEDAMNYTGMPEEARDSFRWRMRRARLEDAFEIMDLCETHEGTDVSTELEEVDLEALDEILAEAGLHLEKDPDLWMVRDECGDVMFGVSAETAMQESIERMARRCAEARKEIESERAAEGAR